MSADKEQKSKAELIKHSSKISEMRSSDTTDAPKPRSVTDSSIKHKKPKVVVKRRPSQLKSSSQRESKVNSTTDSENVSTSPSKKTEDGQKKNVAKKQGIVGGKYVGSPSSKRSNFNAGDRPHKFYKSSKKPQQSANSRKDNVQKTSSFRGASADQRSTSTSRSPTGFSHAGSSPRPNTKTTNRRSFKTKKSNAVYKRKEKQQEKTFYFKKKSVELVNPVPKSIDIMGVITVSKLARKMNLKASDLISKLMGMGMMVTINQQIDAETATLLASEYDCEVRIVSLYDETIIEIESDDGELLQSRPPVVTVMGHVDHGKTRLLDAIRLSNVREDEVGGITQHIGAYQVDVSENKITFLDTPGHEAFTLMRARGAEMTDIIVLVVAANDGVMPQTVEAIHHAKDAAVPIIVAVNKVDLPEANVDRVKQQLADYGLLAEDWGGDVMFCEVSALKNEGIEELLEGIILQSEVLELKANFTTRSEGRIIESKIDPGRGTVATVLIKRGTLRVGDNFLAGVYSGRVRAIFNDRGQLLEIATPSMPVEIIGLSGVPHAGDPFQTAESEKQARQVGDKRQELKKLETAKTVKKITLHNLYDSIREGSIQEVKVIIKGDVQGSVEAIQTSLEKLSTPEVHLSVIHAGAGAINDSDINLAAVSNAIIIGFHVRPTSRAQAIADQEKVEIRKYSIIHDVIEDIRSAMEGILEPELAEEHTGMLEVRDTFKIPKVGIIAGSYVSQGLVRQNSKVRVYREGVEIFNGKMKSLRRFKNDTKEVLQGYECGIGLMGCDDIQIGDVIEVFEIKKIARKLGKSIIELEKEKKDAGTSQEAYNRTQDVKG